MDTEVNHVDGAHHQRSERLPRKREDVRPTREQTVRTAQVVAVDSVGGRQVPYSSQLASIAKKITAP